jgi:hypothetical protein
MAALSVRPCCGGSFQAIFDGPAGAPEQFRALMIFQSLFSQTCSVSQTREIITIIAPFRERLTGRTRPLAAGSASGRGCELIHVDMTPRVG